MIKKVVTGIMVALCISCVASAAGAVPIVRADFDASAQTYVFPDATTDFSLSGGELHPDGYNDYNGFIIEFNAPI